MAIALAFEALDEKDLEALVEKEQEASGWPIRCAGCGHPITTADRRIEMGGAHAHRFANPAGFVYEIGCFRDAPGCRNRGEPTLEWTWFPGHPWSISVCGRCTAHLGWAYGAGDGGGAFFGLILERLAEEP